MPQNRDEASDALGSAQRAAVERPSIQVIDNSGTPFALCAELLRRGLAGLEKAAAELGATTLAVLLTEASVLEMAYPRACIIECHSEIRSALSNESGAIQARTSVACFLTSAIAPHAASFLLFPWRAGRRVVTIVFGFAGPEPAHASIPESIVENLNLAALAAWSVKEADRLRGELRVVNHQLANRKLVERAKSMLQKDRGMTEQEAYECLRKMSRQRRVTLTKLAEDLCVGRAICPPSRPESPQRAAPAGASE